MIFLLTNCSVVSAPLFIFSAFFKANQCAICLVIMTLQNNLKEHQIQAQPQDTQRSALSETGESSDDTGERTLAPRPRSNQLVPFIISHKDQAVRVRTVLGAILHQRLRVLEQNLVTAGYLLSLMTSVHTQKVFSKVQVYSVTTLKIFKKKYSRV